MYATVNNISFRSWRVSGENDRPAESYWQTLSHEVVSSTPLNEWDLNCFLVVIGTHCKGSYKSNYHTITTMTNSGFLRYYTLHHPFIVYFTLSNIKECYIFISIGLCDPNPCHNGGVCHQSGDSYTCTCSGDYYGEKCNGMYHYYCIISLRDEVWAHKRSQTHHFFIELPVPTQESKRSCICVVRVSIWFFIWFLY